ATIRLDNLRIAHAGEVGGDNSLIVPHIGQAVSFAFEPSVAGTTTPFSSTVQGVTARISATNSAGVTTLEAATAQAIGIVAAADALFREPEGISGDTIQIDFDRPIAELRSLVFATSDDSVLGSDVVLDAYLGDQLVATLRQRGHVVYGGRVPQGTF